MIGDKYSVLKDTYFGFQKIKKGDILIEKAAYNFETECREDGKEYNELVHEKYGFICEVGSKWASENTELVEELEKE